LPSRTIRRIYAAAAEGTAWEVFLAEVQVEHGASQTLHGRPSHQGKTVCLSDEIEEKIKLDALAKTKAARKGGLKK
jgi:hypothetical protein